MTAKKTIGIHQPNFLPWGGYFHKMEMCDSFVIFDDVQFSKGSFTPRVKIKNGESDQWITVPTKKSGLNTPINEVLIDRSKDFDKNILKKISQEYSSFPKFDTIYPFLIKSFDDLKGIDSLSLYNTELIKRISTFLAIEKTFILSSDMNVSENQDSLTTICDQLNGDVYISGMGGKKYMDERKFEEKNIVIWYEDFVSFLKLKGIESKHYNKSIIHWMMMGKEKEVFKKSEK